MPYAEPQVKIYNPQIQEPSNANIIKLKEGSGQTFKAGAFVKVTAGRVTECASYDNYIFGIAMNDATGTQDADVWVYRITPDDRIIFNIYNGVTDGSDGAAVGTLATYIGRSYPAAKVAISNDPGLNKWVLDVSTAANTQTNRLRFKIEDIPDANENRTKRGSYVVARLTYPEVWSVELDTSNSGTTTYDAANVGFHGLVGAVATMASDPVSGCAHVSVDFSGTTVTIKTWKSDLTAANVAGRVWLRLTGFMRR